MILALAVFAGAGIAGFVGCYFEEDLPRILEPFAQVGEDEQRRAEGTGLGLPLARSIMELHGGSLELKSEPGSTDPRGL